MRIVFTGPEGATFAGRDIAGITIDEAALDTVAALQRATNLRLQEIIETANANDSEGMMYTLFLSLHTAGHMVSWKRVRSLNMQDFDFVAEPGDNLDDETTEPAAVEGGEDPTVPATGSVPVAAPVEAPAVPSPDIQQ